MRLSQLIDSPDLCGSQRAQPPAQERLQPRPMGGQLFLPLGVVFSELFLPKFKLCVSSENRLLTSAAEELSGTEENELKAG